MNVTITFVLALLACGFGIALLRASLVIRTLRLELISASEAQRSQDSLLTQRSVLDSIKDEFISNVSHELRTPLTSIRGALGLLSVGLKDPVDAKTQNLVRIGVENTDRLIRLINDILDLEQMKSGRSPLRIRRCSLRELTQQSIETMTPLGDAAHVKIELVLAALPEAMYFDGDPDRILQVLANLLSNAIKFSPPESRIEVRIEADADSVLLRVVDQGRGIPEEKLVAVFDRFHQIEVSDARLKGGTGLGLAICKTIVLQHHGNIWAESNASQQRGPGASLTFTLPRVSRVEDIPLNHPSVVLPSTGHGTIILCDDDPEVRTVIGESLQRQGYKVLEAADGEHAIELGVKNPVDAILLDLYMPGITGWETLRRLKNTPSTAGIPVVILSVLAASESSSNAAELGRGAQGWVQKPFDERLLLGELSRVLHVGSGPSYVLLVEDDVDLAQIIVASFEDAELRIDHARTRQKAIELCLIAPPDLIILDIALPDGDGFSLVHWLRQQPDLRSLPLVVYSGQEVSDAEMANLRLGPTQFLTKAKVQPHDVEALVLNIVHRQRTPVGQK